MSDWNSDQAEGEAALRRLQREAAELPDRHRQVCDLLRELWNEADSWHGPQASSHYRSRIRERAAVLGVLLP